MDTGVSHIRAGPEDTWSTAIECMASCRSKQGQECLKAEHGFLWGWAMWPRAMQSGARLSPRRGRAINADKSRGFSWVGACPECCKEALASCRSGAGPGELLLHFPLGGLLHQRCPDICNVEGESDPKLGHKEFSMVVTCPFLSPLPNHVALSILWVQTFSWVPSALAFHSAPLNVLLLWPTVHSSIDS